MPAFAKWGISVLLGMLAQASLALTPLPDSRPAFFAGDWIGTGANDTLCFARLHDDGRGEIYLQGGNGERHGIQFRWRNDRQSLLILEKQVLANYPALRLGPIDAFTLRNGPNRTLTLTAANQTACELQPRQSVLERMRDFESMLLKLEEAKRGKGER